MNRTPRHPIRLVERLLFTAALLVMVGRMLAAEPAASADPAVPAFNFAEAARSVPKPREIWPLVKQYTVPLDCRVITGIDAIVLNPAKRLNFSER